jgi:hypothetical protein
MGVNDAWASVSTDDDSQIQAAALISEHTGIPSDQILERLAFESSFGELVDLVAGSLGDEFLESVLSDDLRVLSGCIYVTDVQRASEEVQRLGSEDLDVCVRESPVTREELSALYEEVRGRLKASISGDVDVAVSYRLDQDALRVHLFTSEDATEAERNAIRDRANSGLAGLDRAFTIDVSPGGLDEACPNTPGVQGGYVEAGRLLRRTCTSPVWVCTSGFAVRDGSIEGILTAAHCFVGGPTNPNGQFNEGITDWASIMYANNTSVMSSVRWVREANYAKGDVQFMREWFTNAILKGRVYLWGTSWQTISSYTNSHPTNAIVCAKGGNTAALAGDHNAGYMCGIIVDNTVDTTTNGVDSDPFAFAAVNYVWPSDPDWPTLRPGDSGSAIFSGSVARGIHKGGNAGYEIYSKIGYALQYLDVTLAPPG